MSSKPQSRIRVLGALAIVLGLPCFMLFRSLAFDDFVSREWLSAAYMTYCVSFILCLHALVFCLHLDLKASRGKGLSKSVPKYLDYVITALLTVGVMQISFADEWLAPYIHRIAGNKAELIDKIRAQAHRHLANDCGKSPYFPQEYCDKLVQITQVKDFAAFTEAKLLSDSAFLHHSIGFHRWGSVESPIRSFATRYRALLEYEAIKVGGADRVAWNWLALLLLPAVIGFRALKTSLELYADLA